VAEVLALASFGRRGVSAARTALGRTRRSRTRPGTDHPRPCGLVWPCPLCFRPLTFIVGIRAPAPRLQPLRRLPMLRTRRDTVTRTPRAAAPSPGLGAKTCTPGTPATLPAPTTRVASAHRSSRKLGPLHTYPCASSYSTTRVEPRPGFTEPTPAALREKLVPMPDTPDRQLQLDFQRRAPRLATIAPTLRPERAPHFTTLGSLQQPVPGSS
jgi:hypothetical protein